MLSSKLLLSLTNCNNFGNNHCNNPILHEAKCNIYGEPGHAWPLEGRTTLVPGGHISSPSSAVGVPSTLM